jgi:type VI secretion system secreted protein Hcp
MAFDAFLKLGDIKGESLDDTHKDEIEIQSFHWGVSNAISIVGGGGGGSVSKGVPQDLLLTANSSKASPKLFVACAEGENLKDGLLTLRTAGANPTTFATVKLSGSVFIASYDQAGVGESGNPTDEFSLRYGKVEFTYNAVKEAFDFQTNKKF